MCIQLSDQSQGFRLHADVKIILGTSGRMVLLALKISISQHRGRSFVGQKETAPAFDVTCWSSSYIFSCCLPSWLTWTRRMRLSALFRKHETDFNFQFRRIIVPEEILHQVNLMLLRNLKGKFPRWNSVAHEGPEPSSSLVTSGETNNWQSETVLSEDQPHPPEKGLPC